MGATVVFTTDHRNWINFVDNDGPLAGGVPYILDDGCAETADHPFLNDEYAGKLRIHVALPRRGNNLKTLNTSIAPQAEWRGEGERGEGW